MLIFWRENSKLAKLLKWDFFVHFQILSTLQYSSNTNRDIIMLWIHECKLQISFESEFDTAHFVFTHIVHIRVKVQCHGQHREGKTDVLQRQILLEQKKRNAWAALLKDDLLPISKTLWGLSCKKSRRNSPSIFFTCDLSSHISRWLLVSKWLGTVSKVKIWKVKKKGKKFLWLRSVGLSEAIFHVTDFVERTNFVIVNKFFQKLIISYFSRIF